MIEEHVDNTLKLIKKPFKQLFKPQLQGLAETIVSFFYNHKRFSIREIASHLLGDTNVKHKTKRFINFLDNLNIDIDFWKSVVILIFSLPNFKLNLRKHITILVDATTLKDDVWILSACISYQGRSIPIFMKTWKYPNKSYDYWKRVDIFLKELREILPPSRKFVIVADRGFQGIEMYLILKKYNFDYIIRLNENYYVREEGDEKYIDLSLFDAGFYFEIDLSKKSNMKTNLAISNLKKEEGGNKKFYVMTSLKNEDAPIEEYARRMWIEETFKDLKSELGWEDYTKKIPQKERLEKCTIISSISYAIQICIGSKIAIPKSEEQKTSVLRRFKNAFITQYRTISSVYKKVITSFNVGIYRNIFVFKYIKG